MAKAPILENKNPLSPSVFQPAALLREARRQKGITAVDVPPVCILDPDGDIVRRLRHSGQARPFDGWPCYHTQLDTFDLAGRQVGIVGCAVGAPFAVLIAEELFASGCRFLISVTSAGQITPAGPPPYFVIIDRAYATKVRATTTRSPANLPLLIRSWLALRSRRLHQAANGSCQVQVGQRMRHSGKPPRRLRQRGPRAFWRSRWRRRRSTPLPGPRTSASSALPMSQIRWVRPEMILRRVRQMALTHLWPLLLHSHV